MLLGTEIGGPSIRHGKLSDGRRRIDGRLHGRNLPSMPLEMQRNYDTVPNEFFALCTLFPDGS